MHLPRFRLRTLMILMAVGPPVLAGAWVFAVKAVEAYRIPKYPNGDLDVLLVEGTWADTNNPFEGYGFEPAPQDTRPMFRFTVRDVLTAAKQEEAARDLRRGMVSADNRP